jgi:alpha-1,6-mannosyltransferase
MVDATMFWSAEGGGGVRRYLFAKRAQLGARRGWRHTIVAPRARGPGMVDCGGLPLPGSGGYRLPWRRAAAARLIAAQAPDLVEAGDPYGLAWAALDAARACRVPAVLFCHSDVPTLAADALARWLHADRSSGWPRDVDRHVGRYLAHTCEGFDLVLAPSCTMQQRLHTLGVGQALHQPLGVDTAVFTPAARDERWRASLGLPPNTRLLLYAGRFAAEKNLPQLVAAVERLGPRYRLLALGQGPLPPRGPQVLRLPFEPDPARVARVLASVDGFVHAGDQETFGLAVLEAMACGTPVAVRNAAGLAEAVAGGCGLAVDSGRVDDWAEAIEALVAAPRRCIDAGLARARAHDWAEVIGLLERRYERVIAGRAAACGAGNS